MQQGEAGRQQSWQIKVYVRANKSRFKFEAKNLKFSIFLKLQKFLLQVKSETQDSLPRKGPRSLISKVKNFCKRSSNPNPPPAKKQTVPAAAKKKSQNLKNPERGSVVNRLVQSASEKPLCVEAAFEGVANGCNGGRHGRGGPTSGWLAVRVRRSAAACSNGERGKGTRTGSPVFAGSSSREKRRRYGGDRFGGWWRRAAVKRKEMEEEGG
ncbi:hypothetical protein Tsubulata_000145 [Turnera subulata]|uniref:Uncharacterized protein n=1 Tax=Turnera subulata TaxID=218843 RepID=A0A9Q0FJG0_9ROSI|nr:hypothetical protein Tsubulata_000145 [Turnera subulata]